MYTSKILILCIFYTSVSYTLQDTVKVTLYYEALCPASLEFVNNQLYPAYQQLGDVLVLDLVPYGNAKKYKDGKWVITCQHGSKECYANKIQACVLGLNYTQAESMNFIGCVMLTEEPEVKENAKECATENKLSWNKIKSCISGEKGTELLVHYGNITKSLSPPLRYVPYIIFNDRDDEDIQEKARDDFLPVVCDMFRERPSGC